MGELSGNIRITDLHRQQPAIAPKQLNLRRQSLSVTFSPVSHFVSHSKIKKIFPFFSIKRYELRPATAGTEAIL
jgi:hypothetical protein